EDVSLTISSTSNLFYEPLNTEVPTANDFDLLFSEPVEQDAVNNELVKTNISDVTNSSCIENSMSQLSLLECPVCDEQFEAP
ncbi:unnamed protein product, partial [Rotaria magnacalcarata]